MINHPNRGRSTTHDVVLRVEFDKPCNRREAAAAVRDCIYGVFYPAAVPAEEFTVVSVGRDFPGLTVEQEALEAAAPDLLAALQALLDWGREHTSPRDPNSPHAILIDAAAAIAKATQS